MLSKIQNVLEAFGEFIIAGLEDLTDQLKGYPDSRYWQGYEDALNHLKKDEHADEKRKTTSGSN